MLTERAGVPTVTLHCKRCVLDRGIAAFGDFLADPLVTSVIASPYIVWRLFRGLD